MKKEQPFRFPCMLTWCCALAQTDAAFCRLHSARPNLHPVTGDLPTAAVDQCSWCDGSGECDSCEGEGEHMCERSGCDDTHSCGACNGSGKCPKCQQRKTRETPDQKWEREYLAFALDSGLTVLPTRWWESSID